MQAWGWIEIAPSVLAEKLSAVLRTSREARNQADTINTLRALAVALPDPGC